MLYRPIYKGVIMNQKLVLVRTSDNRRLITKAKNLSKLVEYASTFDATVHEVKSKTKQVLDLKALAAKLCDATYNNQDPCDVGDKILPQTTKTKTRTGVITDAGIIRRQIKTRLLDGESVSLKSLKREFEHLSLTDACLSNHFSNVRKELEEEGRTVEKHGKGEYWLKAN
jgi:hypothetical protein